MKVGVQVQRERRVDRRRKMALIIERGEGQA